MADEDRQWHSQKLRLQINKTLWQEFFLKRFFFWKKKKLFSNFT